MRFVNKALVLAAFLLVLSLHISYAEPITEPVKPENNSDGCFEKGAECETACMRGIIK